MSRHSSPNASSRHESPATGTGSDLSTGHDHSRCVDQAMQAAEQRCRQTGERLTEIRRTVLAIVWQQHRPLGAYDILERMPANGPRRVAPPTVYRALDFLIAQRLVHRIASLNAYIGCSDPGHAHTGQFMICTRCGTAQELESTAIQQALEQAASSVGFQAESSCVELAGCCAECQLRTPASETPTP